MSVGAPSGGSGDKAAGTTLPCPRRRSLGASSREALWHERGALAPGLPVRGGAALECAAPVRLSGDKTSTLPSHPPLDAHIFQQPPPGIHELFHRPSRCSAL